MVEQYILEVELQQLRVVAMMAVEAMKVEHTIRAPSDGRVTDVKFAVGDRVSEGQELVSFDPM